MKRKHFAALADLSETIRLQNMPENDAWLENNSTLANYCEQSCISDAEKIIRRQLGYIGIGAALDIAGGSDGKALQDLLIDPAVDKALLTNYYDTRGAHAKSIGSLAHIAGNILDASTWDQIEAWRTTNAPEGFSIIMHRPFGALQDLPADVYQVATNDLLDMLRPGGMLLAQIPMALQPWLGGDLQSLCDSLDMRDDIAQIHMPTIVYPLSSTLIIKD